MGDLSDSADSLQVEPAEAELSDAALDALAMLLVDFALSEQETGSAGNEKARTLAGVTGQNSGEHGRGTTFYQTS